MQIAITGGSGRIGPAVIELALSQGHWGVSIDRAAPTQDQDGVPPDVSRVQADVTHYPAFEQALRGCEALIHLAAIPSPRKHPDHVVHNNNVVSSYNALSAAGRWRSSFVGLYPPGCRGTGLYAGARGRFQRPRGCFTLWRRRQSWLCLRANLRSTSIPTYPCVATSAATGAFSTVRKPAVY